MKWRVGSGKGEGPFQIGDLRFQPVPVMHGRLPILGFRLGDFAYVTDVSEIPEESMEKLHGVRWLALDGLRYRAHFSHFSLGGAAEMAAKIGAERTYLIHMCHDVDHDEGNAYLPEGVELAYDGLALEIP